jgi:hypothetical protein
MRNKTALIAPPAKAGRHSKYLTEDEIQSQAIETCMDVIAEWVGFPHHTSVSKEQGSVVQLILELTGTADILLLPAMWKAFNKPKRRFFGLRQNRTLTTSHLSKLRATFAEHGISQPDSAERMIIQDIGNKLEHFGAWKNTELEDNSQPVADKLTAFLRLLMPLLHGTNAMQSDDPLLEKAKTNLDLYSPFRNLAPSRARVLQPGGPFTRAFMSTRSGLFSGLIFRGVTFSSSAIYDTHNNRFDDLDAWTAYYTSKTDEDDGYFCNMAAYGTPNCRRGPQHVQEYWEETCTWEDFLAKGDPSFTATLNYLMSTDEKG